MLTNLTYSDQSDFISSLSLFDPLNFDFHPTANSTPLIGEGTDVGELLQFDFDGKPRGSVTEFVIGPYAY